MPVKKKSFVAKKPGEWIFGPTKRPNNKNSVGHLGMLECELNESDVALR